MLVVDAALDWQYRPLHRGADGVQTYRLGGAFDRVAPDERLNDLYEAAFPDSSSILR